MKKLDIYLQNVRIAKAKRFIKKGDDVLDIGADVGVMFEKCQDLMIHGIGIDPNLETVIQEKNYTVIPGYFPDVCPKDSTFDVITMLAVLEHIPVDQHTALARNCADYLKTGGKLVITVPSPQVDMILDFLMKLKIIDGMLIEEHYGFKPNDTLTIFDSPDFKLVCRERFQFGLNNLFVFEKT
jgi:2-polyprenyl-3-methyl-5-hydroxy-6-metoxy-1,4-benzoquinol methylase